jgi:hypothetical protein
MALLGGELYAFEEGDRVILYDEFSESCSSRSMRSEYSRLPLFLVSQLEDSFSGCPELSESPTKAIFGLGFRFDRADVAVPLLAMPS